jgi:hypothetical protein
MGKKAKSDPPLETDDAWLNEYSLIRPTEALDDFLKSEQLVVDEASSRFAIARLEEIEVNTRPSAGSASAIAKDAAAFHAISLAASLIQDHAGWAIDHQKGLAVVGLDAAMPIPNEPTPNFAARRDRNDQHIHEKRRYLAQDLTPIQARQFVLNVLRPMSQQFNFLVELVVALEALQFGETLPILEATNTRKSGLLENRAKLRALCHMAYQKKKGINKVRTAEDVTQMFAANDESIIKNWARQIRSALGRDFVDQEIKTAEVAAESYLREPLDSILRPYFEDEYGRPSLLRAARMYKRR